MKRFSAKFVCFTVFLYIISSIISYFATNTVLITGLIISIILLPIIIILYYRLIGMLVNGSEVGMKWILWLIATIVAGLLLSIIILTFPFAFISNVSLRMFLVVITPYIIIRSKIILRGYAINHMLSFD